MPKKVERNIKRSNPRLTVNLNQMFGFPFPRDQELKEAVGQAILDKIVERTKKGVDKAKNKFKKYSKVYKDSIEFKAFGKRKGKVDLSLTGDMLGLMDVTKIQGARLTIGWDEGDEQGKAHGHITGAGKLPKRDFFGINNKELNEIKNDFKDEALKAKE